VGSEGDPQRKAPASSIVARKTNKGSKTQRWDGLGFHTRTAVPLKGPFRKPSSGREGKTRVKTALTRVLVRELAENPSHHEMRAVPAHDEGETSEENNTATAGRAEVQLHTVYEELRTKKAPRCGLVQRPTTSSNTSQTCITSAQGGRNGRRALHGLGKKAKPSKGK